MVSDQDLDDWFVGEVLRHESALTGFLHRRWRDAGQIADLRQEVYTRVYDAAREGLPENTAAFVFAVARNLLIDQVRRARIVSIDLVDEIEALAESPVELLTPERALSARQELRLLQQGLERLPPRCREVFELRRLDGLSAVEVADRMGIGKDTVERQTALGLRALADFMFERTGQVLRAGSRWRAKRAGKA